MLKILGCIVIILLTGCSLEQEAAPVVDMNNYQAVTQGFHMVLEGESLYAIAWRYRRDYRELAQANGISPPYRIYPGQKIVLNNHATPVANENTEALSPQKRMPTLMVEFPKKEIQSIKPEQVENGKLADPAWQWPIKGKIIKHFSENGGPKGIDIAGNWGDKIKAAASGKVVYSGSGLRGYGQLVIIKHNDTYLSAYGHNSRLLVKEGEMIEKGQDIAEMGAQGAQNKLHFEIRKNGLPIDPLNMLSA